MVLSVYIYQCEKSPLWLQKLKLFSVLFILQQSSACQPINLLEQRHVLPQTPIEQPTPNLPGVSTDVEINFVLLSDIFKIVCWYLLLVRYYFTCGSQENGFLRECYYLCSSYLGLFIFLWGCEWIIYFAFCYLQDLRKRNCDPRLVHWY